jgi:hypothetical protein
MTLTPETGRIRWEDITSSIDAIASRGYVGKLERRSFIIYRPELSDGQYRLLCLIGDRGGESLYRDDPEPLKAEAERWLEEFASSLGASFPEGECPECGFRPPTHTHDKNCSHHREAAPVAREGE